MFKKGQRVYKIDGGNRNGHMWIREYEVMSWGAKQGTLRRVSDGSMARVTFYTEAYDKTGRCHMRGQFSRIVPVATTPREQAAEIALALGREEIAYELDHVRECVRSAEIAPASLSNKHYLAHMREQLAALEAIPSPLVSWI